MKRSIMDYLHLYLPFQFVWVEDAVPFKKGETGWIHYHDFKYWDNYKKPLFKPVSSITEQDCVNVARLAYGKEGENLSYEKVFGLGEVGEEDNRKVVRFSEGNYVVIYLDKFLIENRDDIDEGVAYCHYDVHNMPEIIRYLLSKQYDLFELIPEGLAIDATLKKAV